MASSPVNRLPEGVVHSAGKSSASMSSRTPSRSKRSLARHCCSLTESRLHAVLVIPRPTSRASSSVRAARNAPAMRSRSRPGSSAPTTIAAVRQRSMASVEGVERVIARFSHACICARAEVNEGRVRRFFKKLFAKGERVTHFGCEMNIV